MARNILSPTIRKLVLAPAIIAALLAFLLVTGLVHDLQSGLLQVVVVVFCIIKRVRADSRQAALDKAVALNELPPSERDANVSSDNNYYRIAWNDQYGTASCRVTQRYGTIAILDAASSRAAHLEVFANSTGEVHIEAVRELMPAGDGEDGENGENRDHGYDSGGGDGQCRQTVKQRVVPQALSHSQIQLGWNLPVTYALVLTNVFCYLASGHFRLQNLLKQNSMDVILAGSSVGSIDEPWRFITPAFLHFSWWHILFNMLALVLFGRICERKLGAFRYISLYFLCIVSSNLLEAVLRGCASNQAGASNAVMGLVGFLFGTVYLRKTLMQAPIARKLFRQWFDVVLVASLVSLYTDSSFSGYTIDLVGHAAGFLSGIACAWVFLGTSRRERILAGASLAIVLVFSYSIARERYFDHDVNAARGLIAMTRQEDALAEEYLKKSIALDTAKLHDTKPVIFSKEWVFSIFGTSTADGLADDYNNAAWIADKGGKYALANRLATAGLLVKDDANTLDTRAVSNMGLGDYAGAEADLIKALKMKPGLDVALFHLAQVMRLKGGEKYLRTRFPERFHFAYEPSEWEYRFGRP